MHELMALTMFAKSPAEKQALAKQIKKLQDIKEQVGNSDKNLRETVSELSKKEIGFGKPGQTDSFAKSKDKMATT
jgi:cell division protein FtsB